MKPATLPVKGADGSDKGTTTVELKVAEETAKGLVHRYVVFVRQNARRVRSGGRGRARRPQLGGPRPCQGSRQPWRRGGGRLAGGGLPCGDRRAPILHGRERQRSGTALWSGMGAACGRA